MRRWRCKFFLSSLLAGGRLHVTSIDCITNCRSSGAESSRSWTSNVLTLLSLRRSFGEDVVPMTRGSQGSSKRYSCRIHSECSTTSITADHDSIIEGTKKCLDRLQMDYVDVIFAHRPDNTGAFLPLLRLRRSEFSYSAMCHPPCPVPMEEIVRAFNFVIDQGWVRRWFRNSCASALPVPYTFSNGSPGRHIRPR